MMNRIAVYGALFAAVFHVSAAGPVMKCESMAQHLSGPGTHIDSAILVAAKGNIPEHCDIRGVIFPENHFAIKLPADWNGRFEMVGNGGTAGTISMSAVDGAVHKGFASASTDTGHDAKKEPLATFAYVTPENPNGHRKMIDFGYLSVHETAVLAKQVIQTYFGVAPTYSYWVGCSTGGRQGLQEAQRYPEDFDGLVVGAPGVYLTGNVMRRIWTGQAQVGDAAIPAEKLPILTKAIYEKCDALDGLKDGLIDDPRNCEFDPAKDLPTGVFSVSQINGLKKIYSGPRDSQGRQVFPGELVGAEAVWPDNVIPPSKTVLPRSESQAKMMMLEPPPGPEWSFTMFNWDTDPARLTKAAVDLNPRNPI